MSSITIPSTGSSENFKPKKLNISPQKESPLKKRAVTTPKWGEEPDLSALSGLNFNSQEVVEEEEEVIPNKRVKPNPKTKLPFLIVEDTPLPETDNKFDYSVIPPKLNEGTVDLPVLGNNGTRKDVEYVPHGTASTVYNITNMYGNIVDGVVGGVTESDSYLSVLNSEDSDDIASLVAEYEHRLSVLRAKQLVMAEEQRLKHR